MNHKKKKRRGKKNCDTNSICKIAPKPVAGAEAGARARASGSGRALNPSPMTVPVRGRDCVS